MTILYLSQSARTTKKSGPRPWYLVQPVAAPDAQVASALKANRRVLQIDTDKLTVVELEAQ